MLENIINKLAEKGKKIAVAESCTGGLLSSKITDISGASAVFDMGIISYSNDIKHKFLDVPEETLATYGAVSSQTAEKMADGVAKAANADYGVSITGIAGPTGGTREKPVGLVFYAIHDKNKNNTIVTELNLDGNRQEIREQTCKKVIEKLNEIIK